MSCRPDLDPAGSIRYEGDRIVARFPARPGLTSRQMFDRVIAPLLRQKGLGMVIPSIAVPPRGYVYQQRIGGVVVEHAALIATPTSIDGLVFSRYRIANHRKLSSSAAIPRDRIALRSELLLYPTASTTDGRMTLRYAWRMLLADRKNRSRTWMAWIDAETGATLASAAQFEGEDG